MPFWSQVGTWWNGIPISIRVGVASFVVGGLLSLGGLWLASATMKPMREQQSLRAFLLAECPLSTLAGQESLSAGGVAFQLAAAALPKVISAAAEQIKAAGSQFQTTASARANGFLYQKDGTGETIVSPGCLALVLAAGDTRHEAGDADLTAEQLESLKGAGVPVSASPELYLELSFRFDRSRGPEHLRIEPSFVHRGRDDARRAFSLLVNLEAVSAGTGESATFLTADFPLAAIKPAQTISGMNLPSLSSKWFPLPRPSIDTFAVQSIEQQDGKTTLASTDSYVENLRPFDASIVLTETYAENPYLLMVSDILSSVTEGLSGAVGNAVTP